VTQVTHEGIMYCRLLLTWMWWSRRWEIP